MRSEVKWPCLPQREEPRAFCEGGGPRDEQNDLTGASWMWLALRAPVGQTLVAPGNHQWHMGPCPFSSQFFFSFYLFLFLISYLISLSFPFYLFHPMFSLLSALIETDGDTGVVAQMLKNLPAMQEAWVWSLGQEDPLEKGMATHSSIVAWRIPWTEEPDGVAKSRTGLSD